MQSIKLLSDHKSPFGGYGSNVSLIFKVFEMLFDVPSRGQYGTWAMVTTLILFSKSLLYWFGFVLHMHSLGRSQDFILSLKGYLSSLSFMPDIPLPPLSGPKGLLFLLPWLDGWVLTSLHYHTLFRRDLFGANQHEKREKNCISPLHYLEHRRPLFQLFC